ncbi:MAG TPA: hypothetical protein VN969_27905 [Streptosporangiaceae bacterium]|nr:hypothetical protein [Streptosporangiaceae bacterium]
MRQLRVLLAGVLMAGATVAGCVAGGTAAAAPVALPGSVSGFAAAGAETGWAIASGGIWHTSTGGATWQRQWQGQGRPVWVTATDSAHAWVLVSCRSSCGRELLGTSDGGTRWRVLATLPAAVNRVQFGSAGFGVATSDACLADQALTRCPGQLLVSHDGGVRWTVALTGAGPVFATVNAAGQLWAASTVVGGRTGSVDARFATSTDGGLRWQRLGQVSGLGTVSPDVQMTLVLGAGGRGAEGQLAWASMYDQLTCAMEGCSVADLLATRDSGRSWSQVSLPDSYPDECAPIEIALSSGWASVSRNGAACSPPLGLVYSHGPSGWAQLPPWQLSGITSLTAVSQDVAYAIGDQGVLSRTTDGGQHWTQVLPAPVPTGSLAAAGAGTVFGAQDASGAGAILRGGPAGWEQVADLPGVVTQLDFTSALDGYAATYTPDAKAPWQLWASTDGGVSWQRSADLPGGGSAVVEGPWLSAGGQGLLLTVANGSPWNPAVGGGGAVREWTTSDGGASWAAGSPPPLGKDTIDGPASFVYASGWTGWLTVANAQYDQEIAALIGGGLSGGRLAVLPGHPPADGGVQLIGPGTGFAWDLAFGRHDSVTLVLERTTDDAQRWTRSELPLPLSAYGALVAFASADDGWLVAGSTTWRTSDGGRTWLVG